MKENLLLTIHCKMQCNSWPDENMIRDVIVAARSEQADPFGAVYFSIIEIVAVQFGNQPCVSIGKPWI